MVGRSGGLRWGGYVLGAALLCAVATEPAWAQQRPQPKPPPQRQPPRPQPRKTPPKWTFEIHGGGLFGQGPTGGTSIANLPVGAAFTAQNGFPSRAISSWYFGDGAALFGQVQSEFAKLFNQQFARIIPLDDTLGRAGARRKTGGSVGVRVTRILSPRYSVEFNVDRNTRALTVTGDAQAAIETTRASFETAFTGLVNTIPQIAARVTSTADAVESGGGQTSVTGALIISLLTRGRLEAHAIAGGGGVFNGSHSVDVQMRGTYAFSIFGTFPINETDAATIHFTDRETAPVGVFGGGITYRLSARQGLRVDLRLLAGGSGVRTTVDATPSAQRVVPASFLPSNTSPSIQFSSTPGIPSTLSGGAVAGLETFKSSGLDLRGQVTVGYFLRF